MLNIRRAATAILIVAVSMSGALVSAQAEPVLDRGAAVAQRADRQYVPVKATIISDSAMAGVRWHEALGALRGFRADDRLESCRRLVDTSCRGREGRRPNTVLVEIGLLPRPAPTDVLIIATGYNDRDVLFAAHSRLVLDAAVGRGFRTIAWVTYREDVSYSLPATTERAVSNYQFMNAELRRIVASGTYPQLQLWDLNDYTRFAGSWFSYDGVHELRRGAFGVADWLSRKMAHLVGQPCPVPWGRAYGAEAPCPDPNAVRPARGYPDLALLYGV